ncbi:MAG: hypothetical protein IPG45_36435 [Deltaproteobacteria bacterium]|nr:hypothetical protein [Deltaproteobacteria bacterium]
MDPLKVRPTGTIGVIGSDPGPPAQDPNLKVPTPSLPPTGHYGAPPTTLGAHHVSPGKLLQVNGFGLTPAAEFGDLPLELRTQLTQDVAQKRRRRVEQDEGARLLTWREDYGRMLTETTLKVGPGLFQLGEHKMAPLENLPGTVNLGLARHATPGGSRFVKLLPQTGFPDFLAGNVLAEQLGGPKIHRFGRAEIQGGTGRLENYRAVMFLEMEELYPGTSLGRLKELMKALKAGEPPRLGLDRIAAGFAELIVRGMIAGVAPADPDLLFGQDGSCRPLDGDAFYRVFDPEEIVGMIRQALNEHGWEMLREPLGQALNAAVEAAPVDDRKRRNLRDALQVY